MKRKIAFPLIVFTCLFLFSVSVQAQEKKFYLGLYGLAAFQNIDEDQTMKKFSGPITIDFDDSWGIQGRLGWIMNNLFTLEAMAEYIFPFEAMTGENKDEMTVRNVLFINGKLTCPAFERFVPYVTGGVGLVNAHEDIHFNGKRSETSDWGAGLRGGVGMDYYFTKQFSLGIEGAYTAGLGNVDHIRYTSVAAGIAYHF